MTSPIGIQRLEQLATYLETTDFAPHKFCLEDWMCDYKTMERVSRGTYTAPKHSRSDESFYMCEGHLMPIDCKTAGCAIGWGIVGIKAFRDAGFAFQRFVLGSVIPCYKGYTNYDAVTHFFDISHDDADHMFHPGKYLPEERQNPKLVAQRIRAYLRDHPHTE